MQNTLSLVKDVRGCMTRFDPLTPEIVADQTEDGLTYDELKEVLEQCGMDIEKMVFDGSRAFQNAFYADFEQGHYCWIPFQKKGLKDVIRTMDQQFRSESFGLSRKNHEWTSFYMMDVPLPMQIYDFERRYKTIEPEQVFEVWSSIHTHIDYANGMWKPEVLEYVFSHAPQTEMPETDEDGLITIYRGMGEMSQDPANAISWSTDHVYALWFANRSGRGTRLVSAKVTPEQILVYNPGYRAEHEVILKPGVRPIFQYADMIPSTEGHVPRLLAPVTAVTLGYPKEGLFMYHGIKHILRVLLDPNEFGRFRYLYSKERTHHFRGPVVETRSWMKKNFPPESRAFMQAEYTHAGPIAMQLRKIPEHRKTEALLHFHRLRYSELDLEKPFLEQFQRNQVKLLAILARMTEEI